jgi:hypothetical protein
MAFNAGVKKLIVTDPKTKRHLPCVMCGSIYPMADAVHIVDEKEWVRQIGHDSKKNGIPLCPNCHRVFDEILRPYLYRALEAFGSRGLPRSWKQNNKLTVVDHNIISGKTPKKTTP